MDADKPFPVVNLTLVRFIGFPKNQVITGNIQGAWDSYISVAEVTAVGVPMDEALLDIEINTRRAVIHLEFYCE